MTERVIDALEVVQVQKENGQLVQVAARLGNGAVEVFPEHRAVGQAGQAVMIGDVTDLLMVVAKVPAHFPERARQVADLVSGCYIDWRLHLALADFAGSAAELLNGSDQQRSQRPEQHGHGHKDADAGDQRNGPGQVVAHGKQFGLGIQGEQVHPVIQPGSAYAGSFTVEIGRD